MSESDTVTVVITTTKKDYAAAVRGMQPHMLRLGSVLFWVSVAALVYFAFEGARAATVHNISMLSGAAGITLYAWYFRFGAPLLAARNFVRKNPMALGPASQTIGPAGVLAESARGQTKADWSAYQRVRETRDLFLLYAQFNFAIIVPKRCFSNPDDIHKYREIVRRCCPGTLELQK